MWCVRNKGLLLLLILFEWVCEVGVGLAVSVRKGFGGLG